MFRHGGVTHDYIHENDDDSTLRLRGRWETDKQFRDYVQVKDYLAKEDLLSPDQIAIWKRLENDPYTLFNVPRP